MALVPNYYNTNPEKEVLLNRAMQNFAQTGNYLGPEQMNRNRGIMPLPPEYAQENNYLARQMPQMGPPSQQDMIAMFRDVKRNPTKYSQEDLDIVKQLYQDMYGKSLFGVEDTNVLNTIGNFGWELADTAAFGLLPDKIAEKVGLRDITGADDLAKLAGMVGAFFVNPISPATTGTRVAGKILPKAANFFKGAEGATTKVPKFLQGLMGGKTEVSGNLISKALSNENVIRRVGGALGGGFNFETGINPLGMGLGFAFPTGLRGPKGTDVSKPAVSAANIGEDAATSALRGAKMMQADDEFLALVRTNPLMDDIMKTVSTKGKLDGNDVGMLSDKYNVSIKQIREGENLIQMFRSKNRTFRLDQVNEGGPVNMNPLSPEIQAQVNKALGPNIPASTIMNYLPQELKKKFTVEDIDELLGLYTESYGSNGSMLDFINFLKSW